MPKSDVNVLTTKLYPIVYSNMQNKNVERELLINIGKYFDRNSDVLYDTGCTNKLFFLDDDKEVIYKACNCTKSEIKDIIKESNYIKDTWKILNEPLNTAFVLLIRYYTIKKDSEKMLNVLLFYSCYFYSSLYFKYLPYGANKAVMDYTINTLSKKFKIKQYGNLFETIRNTVLTSHETYEDRLIRGEDGDYAMYVSALKVRLNDLLKNIKNEYTKNYNANRFLNIDSDDTSEENYHIADNTSYIISKLSQATVTRLNTYGPDLKLAKLSANAAGVSVNEVRNVVSHLSDDDSEKIMKLCDMILQLFLTNGNSSDQIRGKVFLAQCLSIYAKSNTNDKLILDIKKILDEWLKRFSAKYRTTNREPTLSNFRKSIFLYFVLQIQAVTR